MSGRRIGTVRCSTLACDLANFQLLAHCGNIRPNRRLPDDVEKYAML